MKTKIAIGSDHAGYHLKQAIKDKFSNDYEWVDLGTDSTESVDYPDFAAEVAKAFIEGRADKGIVICGSGIGVSIAANRFPQIRAALCTDTSMARLSRQHNDANILALGERLTGEQTAFDIVETFMKTSYEGGRHDKRVKKLSQLC
ncbi:MAG: ribose 5-phosphate isomerase B [Alphaproteobacteria bacterium]|nr:ribose 5-phosphate isomerase B [Alphaproteobacteria bacterium]MBP7757856.1 ribose 5-phosphate isomerase B [Alphaproteobacteria bacterium]MBP7760944.1 ribose 5-phosphate isomerase B [Alphaproteobacteria bacterium]MBP7905282.1 ribose 5-phosphate isomerase B [Alphaproteobacteria bacterium]